MARGKRPLNQRAKQPPPLDDKLGQPVSEALPRPGGHAAELASKDMAAANRRDRRRLIESPWIALVLLPILTTLLGVLAALYLDDWRASRDQKERTIGLLQVARQECDAIIGTLETVQIDQQPVFVPSLGIGLLNIQQDATSLNVIPPQDFRDLLQQLVGIQAALSDYGRLANDFRLLAIQVPRGAPPPVLPMPDAPPRPETPQEAKERFERMMAELEQMRQSYLQHMRDRLQSYKDAVKGFCGVAGRIHEELRAENSLIPVSSPASGEVSGSS